jgi:hypothetical protein
MIAVSLETTIMGLPYSVIFRLKKWKYIVFGVLPFPSIEAPIKYPDTPILLIDTHLIPPKGRLNTYFRSRQLHDLSYYGKAMLKLQL